MDGLLIPVIAAVLILLASMASVEFGVSVALIEISFGVLAGNFLGLSSPPWMDFLASFGSIVLTLPATARTVAEAVTTGVPIVSLDTPAEAVLEQIVESPLRRVVVVDEARRVVGLVSDRDLLTSFQGPSWFVRMLHGPGPLRRPKEAAALAGADRQLTARHLMAPSLVTVRPGDSLAHAIRLMMQHRVKRLIVVEDGGRCLGLVDRREILRLLAQP